MNELNKNKMISGAIACAVVIGAVAFAQRYPPVSDFLIASAEKSTNATHFASTTKAAVGKQRTTSLAAAASDVVNINVASKEQLMTLHGIGSAKADAIMRYRHLNGPFYRPEDIMNVSGIGKAMYETMRDRLTTGNIAPPHAPANPPASALVATSSAQRGAVHVVISQIMAGTKKDAAYKYIELYNAGVEPVDLDGWSIKKRTSTGSVSTLVASSRLRGKIIPASKHFLLADSGYAGAPAPDVVWPPSSAFARSSNAIILYDETGRVIEAVAWREIPEDKSYTRTAPDSKNFTIADPQPHNTSN